MTSNRQSVDWPIVRIRQIGHLYGGGTPSRKRPEFFQGTIPWITGQDIPESHVATIASARHHVTDEAVEESATRVVPAGAVLLTTRVSVGKVAVAGCPICFSQDVTALVIHSPAIVIPAYVAHYLRARRAALLQKSQGSTIAGITRDSLALEQIPIPPFSEQQRIVDILQEAGVVRRLCAEAEDKASEFAPRLFLQMFGDPANNPKNWPRAALSSLAVKFSDGPFGSNLKSSHYTSRGVRVIRLQNIGIGSLLEDDKAFISEEHFASLSKHECLPGDVLIGTLGEPNLRACILPPTIERALNKADCVQFRPDPSKVTAAYICWLLNMPGTLRMAQSLQAGQTRSRISMGRLASLRVPCPPLKLQLEFALALEEVSQAAEASGQSSRILKELAASLSVHTLSGRLTAEWRDTQKEQLGRESRQRDVTLKEAETALLQSSRAPLQEAPRRIELPSGGIYSDLNREQRVLLAYIQQIFADTLRPHYFSAQSLSSSMESALSRNHQVLEGHLVVLATRGLLIAVSREEQTEDTGEYVFANAYRLPLRGYEPREDGEDEPRAEDSRLRELKRLAARLETGKASP